MKNPFIYNSPVLDTDFFNREQIVKNILTEVFIGKTQGDVWITGERKVGKTSLLRFLFSSYPNLVPSEIKIYGSRKEFKPVVALANVQYCRNEKEFFNELWQSAKNILDSKIFVPDAPEINFINAVKNAVENKIYIVFLIDEFDAYLETLAIENAATIRNFINKFNSLLTNFLSYNHKAFGCVFTSNHDFIELNQKYELQITGSGIIAQTFDLEWFNKDYASLLANSYLKLNKIVFTSKELDLVYKYTHGYPYFLQRIYYLAYEYKLSKKGADVDELVIKELAEAEFEQTVKFWTGQNLPKRTYDKLYAFLSTVGKGIFDAALKILIEYSKNKF